MCGGVATRVLMWVPCPDHPSPSHPDLRQRVCQRAAKGFPETAQVLAWARGSGSRKPGRRVPAMHLQR